MAGQLGIWLSEAAMWQWLTGAADDLAGPGEHESQADGRPVPAIGYGWRPREPDAPGITEQLIGQAAAAGVLRLPQGVTVALEYRPDHLRPQSPGTYRILATIAGPDGAEPLIIASPALPWRQIAAPDIAGPRAAAAILADVTEAANTLLDRFDRHTGQAAALWAARPRGDRSCWTPRDGS